MVRSILGHFHQGCLIFQPYNGMQCTAVALIALLTFMKCANNTSFESRDLDEIIRYRRALFVFMQNIMQIFITYTISTPLNDKYFDYFHLNM
jgi:hypothetical protein